MLLFVFFVELARPSLFGQCRFPAGLVGWGGWAWVVCVCVLLVLLLLVQVGPKKTLPYGHSPKTLNAKGRFFRVQGLP